MAGAGLTLASARRWTFRSPPLSPTGRSIRAPAARQDGRGDAAVEAAVLVLDQVVRGLAVPYRGPVRLVRFQPCALLPELPGGAGRTIQETRGSRYQRHP